MSRTWNSRTLLNIDIGRYLLALVLSLDLGIGEPRAVLHSSGSSPSVMDILNNFVISGVIVRAFSRHCGRYITMSTGFTGL